MRYVLTIVLCILLSSPTTTISGQGITESYEKARAQYYDGHYEEALTTVNEYLSLERSIEGYYLQAMIYEAMGNNMGAIKSLSNIVYADEAHLDARFKRGELYYREGIYIQAIEDFNFIVGFSGNTETNAVYFKIDPTGQEQVHVTSLASMKGQVYAMRALALQATGEYDLALEDISYAISKDSTAQNYINRALLYKEIYKYDLAKADLRVAISLRPDLVNAWYNLLLLDPDIQIPDDILMNTEFIPLITYQAVEAFQNGDLELAKSLFSKALVANPDDPILLTNAGRLSYTLENYDDAIKFYMRVISLHPSRFEAYYLIGNSFFQKKEFNQSAAYYEQYLARDRSNANVWYNAAITYMELKDEERACECIQNALERGMVIDSGFSLLQTCNQ